MDIKMKVPTSDGFKEVKGKLVDIIKSNETWSDYELDDGTIIKIKNVMLKLIKLDTKNVDGTQGYSVQMQPVINIIEPENK